MRKKLIPVYLCIIMLLVTACAQTNVQTEPAETSATPENSEEPAESAAQGTVYTGTAAGKNGDVTVEVMLTDGAITDVQVIGHSETAGICEPAIEQVPAEIVAANSADVEAVSGATVTSNAIIEAVKNALAQAGVSSGEEGSASGESSVKYGTVTSDEYAQNVVNLQLEYAPEIRTLDNGVQIQRTPSEYTKAALSCLGDLAYNNHRLNSDNRGCGACHEDLYKTIKSMDLYHVSIDGLGTLDFSVDECLYCHTRMDHYIADADEFGNLIHGIHSTDAFTGDCLSCHASTTDGTWALWDVAKYDILRGINKVASSDINGEFTYCQDKLTSIDDMFSTEWMYGTLGDYSLDRYTARVENVDESDRFDADTWTIEVCGEVNEPKTFLLKDLIAEAPIVTMTMKHHCTVDHPGFGMIANVEVTAIPLSYLIDQCGGYKDDAAYIRAYEIGDGFYLDHQIFRTGYLVLTINGEPLSSRDGYPVAMWIQSGSCGLDVKQIAKLEVCTKDQYDDYWEFIGWVGNTDDLDLITNRPEATILNTYEGQIVDAYQPYTLEGFADAYDLRVIAVEFSMDNGETWQSYDVSDADSIRWIYWTYTFTPEVGAYNIKVRAVAEDGSISYYADHVMINAK